MAGVRAANLGNRHLTSNAVTNLATPPTGKTYKVESLTFVNLGATTATIQVTHLNAGVDVPVKVLNVNGGQSGEWATTHVLGPAETMKVQVTSPLVAVNVWVTASGYQLDGFV